MLPLQTRLKLSTFRFLSYYAMTPGRSHLCVHSERKISSPISVSVHPKRDGGQGHLSSSTYIMANHVLLALCVYGAVFLLEHVWLQPLCFGEEKLWWYSMQRPCNTTVCFQRCGSGLGKPHIWASTNFWYTSEYKTKTLKLFFFE